MATRQNINIAINLIGTGSADQLQTMLAEGKPTSQIANAMGCDERHLVWALAQAAPQPLIPRNWVAVSDGRPYPYAGPYQGIVATPYAGPGPAGFTYGAPLPSREDFS